MAPVQTVLFPYTNIGLTESINLIPNNYGYLQEINLFPEAPIASTIVRVDITEEGIVVLEATPRGSPPAEATRASPVARFFEVPSFTLSDTIKPADLQDILYPRPDGLRTISADEAISLRMEEKLRPTHEITLEYTRVQALKGIVKDGAGKTLFNYFTDFGITPVEVDFDLDEEETDVKAKCGEVIRSIRSNLKGEVMTGVSSIVSSSFFDALVNHASVKELYANWVAADEARHPDSRGVGPMYGRRFRFGNIEFQEYDATFTLKGGSTESAVADGEAHFFPLGTRQTFRTHFAPPDDIRFVNTPGLPIYVSPEILKHGQGVELLSASCPLAMCRRPALLVKGFANKD